MPQNATFTLENLKKILWRAQPLPNPTSSMADTLPNIAINQSPAGRSFDSLFLIDEEEEEDFA